MTTPFFVIAWTVSLLFTTLIGLGVITYIRRTWQLIRADKKGSPETRLLDGIDHLQTHLYSISERLERLERRLGEPETASLDDGAE